MQRRVNETLDTWTTSRGIDVMWDIADNIEPIVFADESLIQRLIVNLVTHAVRESAG